MIDEAAGRDLRFDDYPRCKEFFENLRAKMVEQIGELSAHILPKPENTWN